MARTFWTDSLAWATASGTAVANTTTETILVSNYTVPAGLMADGRVLRIKATGGYGTTATPTLQFRVRWGGVAGTVLAATGAFTTTSGVGGGASMTALWTLEVTVQTRSNGSSGTLMSNGNLHLFTTGTGGGSDLPVASGSTGGTTPVVATVDLTADTALSLTAQWGTANAANSIQLHTYTIEALN